MGEKTKSAGAVTAKNAELDVKRSLLQTFAINENANQKHTLEGMWVQVLRDLRTVRMFATFLGLLMSVLFVAADVHAHQAGKQTWKSLPFAIVRYNDDAPKSWNVYRGDRKGIYLVRLWKRYLLIDTDSQSAFEIDPAKVIVSGETAELAAADIPETPIDTAEWKTRNAGPVLRHRFRFGSTGNFMELQIPVLPNGKPAY